MCWLPSNIYKGNFALESMTKVSKSENIHMNKKEYVTVNKMSNGKSIGLVQNIS